MCSYVSIAFANGLAGFAVPPAFPVPVAGVLLVVVGALPVVVLVCVVPGLVPAAFAPPLAPAPAAPVAAAPDVAVVEVLVPGNVVVGVLVAGVLVAGVLVVGVPAAGAPGEVSAPIPAAGVVTVLVTARVLAPESPASETSAAVIAPRESTMVVLSATIGARQPGIAARRVRAAEPHRRHHSCPAPSGAPHSGQLSATGGGAAGLEVSPGGGAVTLTWSRRADE